MKRRSDGGRSYYGRNDGFNRDNYSSTSRFGSKNYEYVSRRDSSIKRSRNRSRSRSDSKENSRPSVKERLSLNNDYNGFHSFKASNGGHEGSAEERNAVNNEFEYLDTTGLRITIDNDKFMQDSNNNNTMTVNSYSQFAPKPGFQSRLSCRPPLPLNIPPLMSSATIMPNFQSVKTPPTPFPQQSSVANIPPAYHNNNINMRRDNLNGNNFTNTKSHANNIQPTATNRTNNFGNNQNNNKNGYVNSKNSNISVNSSGTKHQMKSNINTESWDNKKVTTTTTNVANNKMKNNSSQIHNKIQSEALNKSNGSSNSSTPNNKSLNRSTSPVNKNNNTNQNQKNNASLTTTVPKTTPTVGRTMVQADFESWDDPPIETAKTPIKSTFVKPTQSNESLSSSGSSDHIKKVRNKTFPYVDIDAPGKDSTPAKNETNKTNGNQKMKKAEQTPFSPITSSQNSNSSINTLLLSSNNLIIDEDYISPVSDNSFSTKNQYDASPMTGNYSSLSELKDNLFERKYNFKVCEFSIMKLKQKKLKQQQQQFQEEQAKTATQLLPLIKQVKQEPQVSPLAPQPAAQQLDHQKHDYYEINRKLQENLRKQKLLFSKASNLLNNELKIQIINENLNKRFNINRQQSDPDIVEYSCKQCNASFVKINCYLNHLYTENHLKRIGGLSSNTALNLTITNANNNGILSEELSNVSSSQPKGVEFLFPTKAFYCSLCDELCDNEVLTELHIRSVSHNLKYQELMDQ